MHPSAIRARAETLREWAAEFEREDQAAPGAGYSEGFFLLRRAAKHLDAVANGDGNAVQEQSMPVALRGGDLESDGLGPIDSAQIREG